MPYITPDSTPPSSNCRRLFVSNDEKMIAAILGQLLELTEAHNWEQTSGITVQETTDFWLETYENFSKGIFCMIGAIVPLLNDTIPDNMLECDGSTFLRVDYPELYAVLPAALIQDVDTGILPDLQDNFVIGASAGHLQHSTGGSTTHTLTTDEMPAHTHTYDKPILGVDLEGVGIPDPTSVGLPFLSTPTGSTGDGNAHDNMPPFYALRYAVIAK